MRRFNLNFGLFVVAALAFVAAASGTETISVFDNGMDGTCCISSDAAWKYQDVLFDLVSREHAELEVTADTVILRDLKVGLKTPRIRVSMDPSQHMGAGDLADKRVAGAGRRGRRLAGRGIWRSRCRT